ncbi:MAG: diaminopimelate decarboxylase [Gammaproteobacteria bacterium TMED180]|nr:MAG: diaminopimelate decarboxylase [Gammaproteobacteria bacterium TMED180]
MLSREENQLFFDKISIKELAEKYGTPSFVYSEERIVENFLTIKRAFSSTSTDICFAVKANSNIGILQILARQGAGFDIVSGGELARVLKAGGDPKKIVFSGVGKQDWEIIEGLQNRIRCFNVESAAELEKIAQIASSCGQIAPVSLRVNPNIDAKTHPYISTGLAESKFGIKIESAEHLFQRAHEDPYLNLVGIDCHIGSQITEIEPFRAALNILINLVQRLAGKGINLSHIDIGGGVGIKYKDEEVVNWKDFASEIKKSMKDIPQRLILEPGRSIVGDAGLLLAQIILLKNNGQKNFAVVDAGMNDLLRPALYGSWHEIISVEKRTHPEPLDWEIVGPICETSDFLAKGRSLSIIEGDLIAILDCGAYGFSMSSNYNSRPKAAEILIADKSHFCIRNREKISDLFYLENLRST